MVGGPGRVPAFGAVVLPSRAQGKLMHKPPRQWTPHDEQRLLAMIAGGKRTEEAAAELKRLSEPSMLGLTRCTFHSSGSG